eukprot:gene6011-12121_t
MVYCWNLLALFVAFFQQCHAFTIYNHKFGRSLTSLHDRKILDKRPQESSLSFIEQLKNSSDTSSQFLYSLKSTAHSKSIVLSKSDRNDIIKEIDFRIKSFNFSALCEIIWCIGLLNIKQSDGDIKRLVDDIIKALVITSSGDETGFNARSISILLNGLVKTEIFTWKDIPLEAKTVLLNQIIKHILNKENMNNNYISDILWGLAKLNVKWKNLDESFKIALFEDLFWRRNLGTLISKTLYALSLMDLKWNEIPKNVQFTFLNAMTSNCKDLNEQETVNLVYALGKMDANWKYLALSSRKELLTAIETVTSRMKGFAIANTLWGLGKCSVNWKKDIPSRLKLKLLGRVEVLSPLNPHSVSSILSGLSRMDVDWDSLPVVTKEALENSEQSVANIIYSLGTMGASTSTIHPRTIAVLVEAVQFVCSRYTAQGLSNSLYGLANIGCKWVELPLEVRDEVQVACLRLLPMLNDQSVSNIIWSLGQMQCSWNKTVTATTVTATTVPITDNHKKNSDSSSRYNDQQQNVQLASQSDNDNNNNNGDRSILDIIDESNHNINIDENNDNNKIIINPTYQSSTVLLSTNISSTALLSTELWDGLMSAVDRTSVMLTELGVAQIFLGLAKTGVSWSDIPPITRQRLVDTILTLESNIGHQAVSNCLWSLAHMGVKWEKKNLNTSKNDTNVDIEADIEVEESGIESAVSSPKVYSKKNLKYTPRHTVKDTEIKTNLLTSLSNSLIRIFGASSSNATSRSSSSSTVTPQTIAVCLNSLVRMDVRWVDMNASLKEAILYGIENIRGNITRHQDTANIIYGLGRLKINWNVMNENTRGILLTAIERCAFTFNEQEIGNVIWGLSQMNCVYTSLSEDVYTSINNALIRLQLQLKRESLVAVLQGLSRSGNTDFNKLPIDIQKVLIDTCVRITSANTKPNGSTNGNEIVVAGTGTTTGKATMRRSKNSLLKQEDVVIVDARLNTNIIHSLGRLSCSVNNLPNNLKDKLISHLYINDNDNDNKSTYDKKSCEILAFSLNGMARMGFVWTMLNEELQHGICTSICKLATSMSTYELVCTIWALGRMNARWSKLPVEVTNVLNAVLDTKLKHFQHSELTWTLWSLGKMGVNWDDLSIDFHKIVFNTMEAILSDISAEELGVVLWALGRLHVPVNEFPVFLRSYLLEGIEALAYNNIRKEKENNKDNSNNSNSNSSNVALERLGAPPPSAFQLHAGRPSVFHQLEPYHGNSSNLINHQYSSNMNHHRHSIINSSRIFLMNIRFEPIITIMD